MDSDDICHKDRFKIQLNILNSDNSIDIVCSHTQEFMNTNIKENYLYLKKCPEHCPRGTKK